MINGPYDVTQFEFDKLGPPRYEQLAQSIGRAIRERRLNAGDRLPPVRQLAEDLGVSITTVTSAFDLLSEQGLIRPEVGRGTFVAEIPAVTPVRMPSAATQPQIPGIRSPWRRRALMSLCARLRGTYPNAVDCSTGRPDVALLPLGVVQRAWRPAAEKASAVDLQYAGPEPIEPLAERLVTLLQEDGIPVRPTDFVVGSSAQQLMMLSLEAACALGGGRPPVIAVEEPGYPTIMDAFERVGATLIGVAVDEQGVVPDSLDSALKNGAIMALFTPRAHNPTGASWSRERRSALADVFAEHAAVVAVEDDQFAGIATTRPGSLLGDERVSERVVYIRSFSKSVGPDLRLAVAAARPRLRALLAEAKSFADGWTSRLLQKVLAAALADGELADVLGRARDAYRERRLEASRAVNSLLEAHGGWTRCGPDGLNLWVHLPPGADAAEVVERAAAAGVLVASGEPFFIQPGQNNVVRLNAGSAPAEKAAEAGRRAAEAMLLARSKGFGLIHV